MGIRLRNVTLNDRLKFMEANIRSSPSQPELERVSAGQDPALIGGLLAFRSLLERIYTAGEVLEGKDDEKKFDELCEAMLLLYTCAVFGELETREGQQAIDIDKEALLSKYKRGGISRKTRLLGHHGLVMVWLSSSGDRVPQSKASVLSLTFPEDERLVRAMRYLATSIDALEPRGSVQTRRPYTHFSFDSISNKLEIFGKADFEAALTPTNLARDALDPLREDVVATAGKYGQAWVRLVDKLMNQYALMCFGSFYFGQWGVSFHRKRQRPFLIFSMTYELPGVELTLPVDAAERIIRQRHTYSQPTQEQIEAFHCVQCPKECKGENIIKVDGITLCTGRAEARRVYMEISTEKDWQSIEAIADTAFAR